MVAANETVVDVAVAPAEQKPELTIEEKTSTMKDAFAAGKRDYISGEFDTAADKLGQAASLSVEIYGEFAVESFDAHLYYGKALLELGRAEEDVIKTAMKDMPLPDENNESIDEEKYGNPDTLTETEREEIKDKVEEALAENAEELEAKSAESEDSKSTSDDKKTEGDVASEAQAEKSDVVETKTEGDVVEAQIEKSDVVEKNTDQEAVEATSASNKDEKETSDVEVPVVPESATTAATESSDEAATDSTEKTTAVETSAPETTTPAAEEPMEQSAEENNEDNDVAEGENGAEDDQESEGDDGSEGPEEPSSIQAAWEVLEVARSICDKRDSCKEWDLKKADVLLTLGECSIEDENYKQAVDDITMCIELYKKHMDACDRVIAQAFVTMARAYKLHDDFTNAGVYYTKAKETLLAKIEALTAKLEGASEEEKAAVQKELDELKELVPDLDLKIEDSADSAKQTEENMDKIRQQMGLSTAPVLAEKTDAPAQDISSLVRKPAKRVAETVEESDDAKRVKADADTSATAAV